ncbi:MAG: lysophospholipase [Oscillatoriales cyanobacterium C42_A2020_001]|nr:lysophospholipase [Leptolyngbyaceae cyanobacterium C42_A2020_001]
MPEPLLLAAIAAQPAQPVQPTQDIPPVVAVETQRSQSIQAEKARLDRLLRQLRKNVNPEPSGTVTEFSPSLERPRSGSQLYSQRAAALTGGHIHTRLPASSFRASWATSVQQPTYEQWKWLLAQEAASVRGTNQPVGVLLGDSLSLWFPSDRLPQTRLWLNQGISGDTTTGILRRLSSFAHARPRIVYVMAGVNDLKHGVSDATILRNLQQIIQQLRQTHPQAQIVMQSLLPTRSLPVSSQRITHLNQQLKAITQQNGAYYLDVYSHMADATGYLQADLTTDGLHLNARGYEVWQSVLNRAEAQIASK